MNKLFVLLIFIVALACSGCMYVVRYDSDYRGRVFDGETKAPIEGAAVLGVWFTGTPTPAGAISHYYDAREALTDKNGDFSIPGMGLRVLSNLEPMSVMVFKSGYTVVESRIWESLETKVELDKTIHDKAIDRTSFPYKIQDSKDYWPYMDSSGVAQFPLRKLTLKELNALPPPGRPSAPYYKMQLMIKEFNRYNKILGLKPFTIRGEPK
jgi:hypothetical protein